MLTQTELKRLLEYDRDTGTLYWKWREEGPLNWNKRWAGKQVGSTSKSEAASSYYLAVRIKGVDTYVHRLIWCLEYGTTPLNIDHTDGDGLNNRITNLREVTSSQNLANSNKVNRGVFLDHGKYRAMIRVEGDLIHLGTFSSYDEAQASYNQAADTYFGEFARINR